MALLYATIGFLAVVGVLTGTVILLSLLAASLISGLFTVVWILVAPFVFLCGRIFQLLRPRKTRR